MARTNRPPSAFADQRATIMRILPINYVAKDVVATIRGKGTNEIKQSLVKSGYDIFCPICDNHFSLGTITNRIICPKCNYRWKVNSYGKPTQCFPGLTAGQEGRR